MGTGTSILLIAAGAILYFAVHVSVSGVSLHMVGLILMVLGAIGLVLSLLFVLSARRRVAYRDRVY